MNETQVDNVSNTNTEQNTISIEVVNDNIISLNNNMVSLGITIIFLLSVIIGILFGKVLKLWN